ncbi:hypothetical protein [Azospira inquinata]|uniref:Uncharacterized protein n=1 Tax=Azospira inquinata TaxID=2785627 RepID=A0A975SNQ2_9RHOO|nr:hypothetical protein [Azospira inquinata]QWT44930.1 hypothetical protein J8L76_08125 [Azospira inquinata]QWT49738.1 hypothetical protein Azoinq_03755 [Azospira inquinata]
MKVCNSSMRIVSLFAGVILSLLTIGALAEGATVVPLTPSSYAEGSATKGIILFSIRWDRRWKCAGFENAQLRRLAFDKMPVTRTSNDPHADLVLADAPLLLTHPQFDDYAFVVEPGEYALVGFDIKVAASITDVRIGRVDRERLIKEGKPDGGSFDVAPGEAVYIGHFYLDCATEPMPWRYYLSGQEAFDEYTEKIKKQHPELDATKIQYRLFKTKLLGRNFELK